MRYVGNKLITEGKFEKDGKIFEYEIAWISDGEDYQIDEIWDSNVYDSQHNMLYDDDIPDNCDDLIIEDAYKHIPQVEEPEMTYEDYCNKIAEEKYEQMQIDKHFA